MNNLNPQSYQFGDLALSQAVFIDGIPHITKQAIGEWLEYSEPRKNINKILERNIHIDEFSVDVKLTSTDGKNYDTRVYHPMGFLLIVMESGQPKAIAMKVSVAEFVWQFSRTSSVPLKDRNTYLREIERLSEALVNTRDAMLKQQRIRSLQYYCQLAAWPMPDLEMLGKEADQLPLI